MSIFAVQFLRMWRNGRRATLRGWWEFSCASSSLAIRTQARDRFSGLWLCFCPPHQPKRHQRKITLYSDQYRYRSQSGSGRGKVSSTSTDIAAKVVVVAAKYHRPVPISQPKWQWLQQNIVDQYRYRSKSGSGRRKTSSTSTRIPAKVVVVATNYRQPLPRSQQNR